MRTGPSGIRLIYIYKAVPKQLDRSASAATNGGNGEAANITAVLYIVHVGAANMYRLKA